MDECIICFEKLEYNIAILKCNHRYHFECITSWINKRNSLTKFCPLCSDTENEIINVINVKNDSHSENKEKRKDKLCVIC